MARTGDVSLIIERAQIKSSSETWVALEISKSCLVVLTRAEFITALKRGKAWRRSAAMKARLGQKDACAREFNVP